MTRKEKYIVKRYSTAKNGKKILSDFQVLIHYKDASGKRKSVSRRFYIKDFKTPALAMKHAAEWRDDTLVELRKKGEAQKNLIETKTVDQVNKEVEKYYLRSKSTMIKNAKLYRKYIKPNYGNRLIGEIKPGDISENLNLCAETCCSTHVGNLKSAWRYIFATAIQMGLVQNNIVDIVRSPKNNHTSERSQKEQNITQEQFEKYCEAFERYGHYAHDDVEKIYNRNMCLNLIKLLRVTGLRSQEARALSKDNIRIEIDEDGVKSGRIFVTSSIGSSATQLNIVKNTKTPQSRRVIPLFGQDVDLLEKIIADAKGESLFEKWNGEKLTSTELADYMNRVSKACGIKVYATLLRKSFAADLYNDKISPVTIRRLMGHATENMSLNWYATISDDEVIKTMKKRRYIYKKD